MFEHLPAGLYPVMLTAFHDDGAIDWPGVDALTDWYIENGATGLFAVCLSSEMYDLSDYERLSLARRVVRRARGRAAVVATGTFGGPVAAQAASVRAMAETGVHAVVAIPSQLASADEGEAALEARLMQVVELAEDIPLGLYECPAPYHRLLSAELLGRLAATGRFLYHKDTCSAAGSILSKLEAIRGTPLGFFNANTATALMSLQHGATGLSPIGANYYPGLYVRLMRIYAQEPLAAADLQRMLCVMEGLASTRYPAAAKRCLAMLGLPIGLRCRVPTPTFAYEDDVMLAALMETAHTLA
jgi:4-hydroxy-tetrahydrodipicolinate synthase